MALTRKFLKALGIDEDKIEEIITAHGDTVAALKTEIEQAKSSAEGLEAVTKERDALKNDLENMRKTSGDAAKVQAEFDAYRAKVETERTAAAKRTALDPILRKAGVARDSFRKHLCDVWNLDTVEMDESGAISNEDAIISKIKTDYSDFTGTVTTDGTPPATPPTGGRVMTLEDFGKMPLSERMRFANEHPEEFKQIK